MGSTVADSRKRSSSVLIRRERGLFCGDVGSTVVGAVEVPFPPLLLPPAAAEVQVRFCVFAVSTPLARCQKGWKMPPQRSSTRLLKWPEMLLTGPGLAQTWPAWCPTYMEAKDAIRASTFPANSAAARRV
jgi:hypothetical protein